MIRKVILASSLVCIVLVTSCALYIVSKRYRSRLQELHSIAELREKFNQDRGQPRLVLLLSPT